MKKVLPINLYPRLHAYTHHGYLHAILSASDKVKDSSDKEVADIVVKNYNNYKWNVENGQLNYNLLEKGQIKFYSHQWETGMNAVFWRTCQQDDEIELEINEQLYSNAWSSISVFINDCDVKDLFNRDLNDLSAGYFMKDGFYYSVQQGIHQRLHKKMSFPVEIKLKKEDRKIFMTYGKTGEVSERLLIKELEDGEKPDKIGFVINLGDNSYYEWLFSNYINITYETKSLIPIDYLVNLHKNWNVHSINYFMDYVTETESEVKELGFTLFEYIKKQIDLNNYIEIELNNNIHKHRTDEYGKLFHQNLIYGYDDEERCFSVLYYHFGKMYATKMTYDDFNSERNKRDYCQFFVLKYNPGYEVCQLSPKHILQLYREYRDEMNISFYEPRYESGFWLGIGCYDFICNTKEGIDSIMDVRIPYFLYERTNCNLDRMSYLKVKGIITDKDYQCLCDILKEENELLHTINNVVIKKNLGGRVEENIEVDMLKNAFKQEKMFTDQIIAVLEKVTE